jgi:hypothetical protein
VLKLSRRMTIRDVAAHLGVGWDLVKDVQKRDLSRRYAKPKLKHLRHIAIDEIAVAGTISHRMILRGQFFPQLLRGQLEELPEAQLGEIQAQQAVRRLIFAAAGPEATQVPVQTLQVQ